MEYNIEIPTGNKVLIYTSPDRKIYYRIYQHKDPIMDNFLIFERVNPLEKGAKRKEDHIILDKDFHGWLRYLYNEEGYNEIKEEEPPNVFKNI